MALARNVTLSTHFTAGELGADNPAASTAVVANLFFLAAWLEAMRGVMNVELPPGMQRRVFITSGFRTATHNAEVGGAVNSDHVTGLAADFTVEGLTAYQVFTRLQAAKASGALPVFDQLIFYVVDDHIHVGLGPLHRGSFLLKTTEGSYVALISGAVRQLRGYV